jgi:hypothetical protein
MQKESAQQIAQTTGIGLCNGVQNGVQSDEIESRYSNLPTIHACIWDQNTMAKSADVEGKNAARIARERYLISCFSCAAAYCRLLPTLQKTPEKPLFSPAKQSDFVTTDQQALVTIDICVSANAQLSASAINETRFRFRYSLL